MLIRVLVLKIIFLGFLLQTAKATSSISPYEIVVKRSLKNHSHFKLIQVPKKLDFLRNLTESPNPKENFHLVDLCVLPERLRLWKSQLPRVKPYYAIKTNHDPILVEVMAGLGTGFDCASEKEIENAIHLGVSPNRIIFAHPRKTITGIKRAVQLGVRKMVFDSIEELDKMLKYAPRSQYILRIKTDDSHSLNPLSSKFGVSLNEAFRILDFAFQKNAKVVGIAFHVGSNCTQVESYEKALMDTFKLFEYARLTWGKKLSVVDLGGGWPGTHDELFINFSKRISKLLDLYFPNEIEIISEPGRFFSSKVTTLVMQIIGKTSIFDEKTRKKSFSYYLTNGVYGSFMSSVYYNYNQKEILSEGWKFYPVTPPRAPQLIYPSLLWGPSCDSGDKIFDALPLPELESGTFLYVEDAGAYTTAIQTKFNHIAESIPYYVCIL